MKLFLTVILMILTLALTMPAFAEDQIDSSQPKSSSYTNYKDCIRLYKLPFDKLYLLALSSVNANKFEIEEMQSRNGYIIFSDGGKEYLLSVLKKDKSFTFLKLAPCDNNYYFSPTIPYKIFNYADLHFNSEVRELKF